MFTNTSLINLIIIYFGISCLTNTHYRNCCEFYFTLSCKLLIIYLSLYHWYIILVRHARLWCLLLKWPAVNTAVIAYCLLLAFAMQDCLACQETCMVVQATTNNLFIFVSLIHNFSSACQTVVSPSKMVSCKYYSNTACCQPLQCRIAWHAQKLVPIFIIKTVLYSDARPTLNHHWFNVSCLPGYLLVLTPQPH